MSHGSRVTGRYSIYIHIPFCARKCNYCDFVSYAGKEELIDKYVEILCEDIRLATLDSRPATVYFGGGTPTLLEPRHFEKILKTLPLSPWERGKEGVRAVEITIEANPGTANLDKLKALGQLGINRLSIGAQSFNNQHLKTLGRIHTAKETLKFYDDARSAGFDNINLDLIFALPDQTLDEWKKDLETALLLNPNHLSTYNLQIEEGTPLWEMANAPSPDTLKTLTLSQRERVLPADEGFLLPTEEEELTMYEYTIETLTANSYKHYEISNFARPGFECLHNINYWKNGNYIGIGAGAHSHVNGRRWANPDSIEEYLRAIPDPRSTIHDPRSTNQSETIFMGLRLLEGLPTEKFQGFEKEVSELTEDGLLARKNGHYKLTRRGLYLANLVFEKFI